MTTQLILNTVLFIQIDEHSDFIFNTHQNSMLKPTS